MISARDNYEKEFGMENWKMQAFLELRNAQQGQSRDTITNLVVVGDSKYEMEAGEELCKQTEKCVVKSIKMSESPSIGELIKQLSLINEKWEGIVSTFKSLSIKLERKSETSAEEKRARGERKKEYQGVPGKVMPSFHNIRLRK